LTKLRIRQCVVDGDRLWIDETKGCEDQAFEDRGACLKASLADLDSFSVFVSHRSS
jgi:hypothetical protein